MQKEPAQGAAVANIILLTQRIREAQMDRAIAAIQALEPVSGEVTRIRVENLSAD